MSTDCCEFCGSFGDCHDSCVGTEVRPLMAEIENLRSENTRLRALVKRAGELDRTHVGKELDAFCEECRREVSDERKEVL